MYLLYIIMSLLGEMCCNTPVDALFFHILLMQGFWYSRGYHGTSGYILHFPEESSGKKGKCEYIHIKASNQDSVPIVPWFASPSINTKQLQLVRRELNFSIAKQMGKTENK